MKRVDSEPLLNFARAKMRDSLEELKARGLSDREVMGGILSFGFVLGGLMGCIKKEEKGIEYLAMLHDFLNEGFEAERDARRDSMPN